MKAKKVNMSKCIPPSGIGFPLFVILLGVYYLLKAMGYIQDSALFWPIVIIAIGVYWLIAKVKRSCK